MKHTNLIISTAIISLFSFLYVPRYDGLGEGIKKDENETEVRSVEYPVSIGFLAHPKTDFPGSIAPQPRGCQCRKGRFSKDLVESFL